MVNLTAAITSLLNIEPNTVTPKATNIVAATIFLLNFLDFLFDRLLLNVISYPSSTELLMIYLLNISLRLGLFLCWIAY